MKRLKAMLFLMVMAAVMMFSATVFAADLNSEVIYYVNAERVANGLAPLSYAEELSRPAAVRANDITVHFAHQRPDGSEVKSVLEGASYDWFGENLAVSSVQDSQKIVHAWMNSPTHRANLLNRHFTQMAVACVRGDDGHFYWAQLLASD